jgi:N utilization substance protein B
VSGPATGLRRRAREVAFRVAYQADMAGDAYTFAWQLRREEEMLSEDQLELIEDIVRTLESGGADIDARLRVAAEHWPLQRLAATDRAVLRVSMAELVARPASPARVVIDECIEIARRYGSADSGRFVNGVLDRAARELRPAEF